MKTQFLIAPGLGNSGEIHWQTIWEQEHPEMVRIHQKNWDAPVCSQWVDEIEKTVTQFPNREIVVIAHSLACIALAHWSLQSRYKIKAALLVAPADVERPSFTPRAIGFKPIPLEKLPFESIVIASSNDEYTTIDRSIHFARKWGSDFIHIGAKGHINASSKLGNWMDGKPLLRQLAPDFEFTPDWSI